MNIVDRLGGVVTQRSKTVIVVLLVVTLIVGAGAGSIEESTEMEMFEEEPSEVETERYVQEAFTPHEENTTQLVVMVRNESGTVLDRDSLLESLRYQHAIRENETVGPTLVAEEPTLGVENLVAATAIQHERGDAGNDSAVSELPPLSDQIAHLESRSDEAVEQLVESLLDPESEMGAPTDLALELLPESYEPGSTETDGRLTVVTHETDGLVVSIPELSEDVRDGQVTAGHLADDVPRDEYRLSGYGLMLAEEEQSMEDSLALVGPIALVFVLLVLAFVYRDVTDLVLGMVGVLLVLVWTFGAMGWLGLDFTLLTVAIPVLLIGLSIDYCIHVVMRYRENLAGNGVTDSVAATDTPREAVRTAMTAGLSGLTPALALVTATAAIGFLSIRVSDAPALAEFGLVTALGIVSALVIFGALVPALKVELDARHAGYVDRPKRAFGTTGRVRAALAAVARVSCRRPVTVVVVVLLVSSVGALGATHLETDFSTDEYIAEDAPGWTEELPESLSPSEYEVRETHDKLYADFQSPDQQVHVVLEGNVTDSTALERVAAAEVAAADRPVVATRSTGAPAVIGPVGAMHDVAETNETFATLLEDADTAGDGVPDENVTAVFEAFSEAAPAVADQLFHRTDTGEYEALQIAVVVDGTEDPSAVASEMRTVGDVADGTGVTVAVAGEPILNELVQRQLTTTTVEGLAVALVAVLGVLVVAFRHSRSSATLGVVTLAPVVFGLCWILGAMSLVGIPLSFMTALIGSIAIGLGVDYAIHMSERFAFELDRQGSVEAALEASVVGTGGALLSSAATTAGGFGVLAFSLVPAMQHFGVLIALTLVTAFVASVLVLPSLLVLWERAVRQPGTDGGYDTEEQPPLADCRR